MKSAGGGIGSAAELAAGMELGEHDLDPGQARLRLDIHRNPAGAVAHFDTVIGVQHHGDLIAMSTECLVDRVVDDLPQAVHQAARICGSDVHAWTLTYRLEPLEHR